MKILARVSYESLYVIWSAISKIADLIYVIVCAVDKWLAAHEE